MEIRARQTQLKLGVFPGVLSGLKGDEAPRLKCKIVVQLTDRITGERSTKEIPFETSEPEHVLPWIEQALTHERTRKDLESFLAGRIG